MINNHIIQYICSELKEKGWDENQIQEIKIQEEIKNMGEEALKFYNLVKNDPFITEFKMWDVGFAFLSSADTIRYIYIKPSERNKGLCSELVKLYKISDPTPEIIHIMDKNDLLYDLETPGFKIIAHSEEEILCYDVKLGYQIKVLSPEFISLAYNRWTGEYFEVVDEIIPMCSLKDMRKRMERNLKKLKTTDNHRIEGEPYGLWNQ